MLIIRLFHRLAAAAALDAYKYLFADRKILFQLMVFHEQIFAIERN